MDDEAKTFKTKLNKIKLITSSIFARKQQFMVINGATPTTFYYTNVESERVKMYRPTMEDSISKVVINEEVSKTLFEAFPDLTKGIVEIDLTKFSSTLNKAVSVEKGVFPELKVDMAARLVTMTVKGDLPVVLGKVLLDFEIDFYEEIFRKYNEFSDNVQVVKYKANMENNGSKLDVDIVELSSSDESAPFKLGLPLRDGFSAVSAREYCKRRGLVPVYDLEFMRDIANETAKVTMCYCDDWINSRTIMPACLWFMFRR